ncbi:hypothetical protein [Erythrobacter alti]|uniref:hypothetical protein n=1 Tax=Erythrobacter alti TaxID=1896145 RepID=UPI0030F3EC0D
MTALALVGCAAPGHQVNDNSDLLADPRGVETLDEQISREGQGDGCLVAGNAGRNRSNGLPGFANPCRDLRDVIAPPELPEATTQPPTSR